MSIEFDQDVGRTTAESSDFQASHSIVEPGRPIGPNSSVLAVVPHFRCEPWLPDCLDSLVKQTRPLQGIVVIDDGSGQPPVDILGQFPGVTLLASNQNVGPYRLIQQVIDNTAYDAYMFQDADDWSMENRLALLLDEAERSGAEMVGCMAYRLIGVEGEVVPLTYPLDVNAALQMNPNGHAIIHPTSVVSRDLIQRVGGYATGLRFGGDTEFERRAGYVARVVNVPHFAYVVRNRANSLTSSPETGLSSPERKELIDIQRERAQENAILIEAGLPPKLAPLAVARPVPLHHVTGPMLRGADGNPWPI